MHKAVCATGMCCKDAACNMREDASRKGRAEGEAREGAKVIQEFSCRVDDEEARLRCEDVSGHISKAVYAIFTDGESNFVLSFNFYRILQNFSWSCSCLCWAAIVCVCVTIIHVCATIVHSMVPLFVSFCHYLCLGSLCLYLCLCWVAILYAWLVRFQSSRSRILPSLKSSSQTE